MTINLSTTTNPLMLKDQENRVIGVIMLECADAYDEEIYLRGWVIGPHTLFIFANGVHLAGNFSWNQRPDVSEAYNLPEAIETGFEITANTGESTLSLVWVLDIDGQSTPIEFIVTLRKVPKQVYPVHVVHDPSQYSGNIIVQSSARWQEPTYPPSVWLTHPNNPQQPPTRPDIMQGTRFELELDHTWMLNGHRNFLRWHNEGEIEFLVDRCVGREAVDYAALINTDSNTHLVWQPETQKFSYKSPLKPIPVIEISGETGVAVSCEPSNWGSFLVRILPKVMIFKEREYSRIFMYAHSPKQQEFLHLIGVTSELAPQDVYYNYRFEKATVLSEPTNALFMEPKARNRLLALGQRMRRSRTGRRIYVSRRSELGMKNGRICINEEAVERCLESYGFEIIRPEALSVIEQIQTFAEADRVVGCSGAGMFNTVFCQPGTQVIEIASRPNWLWGHMNLYNSLGMDYGFVWAVPILDPTKEAHTPFEVDINQLRRGLAEQGL